MNSKVTSSSVQIPEYRSVRNATTSPALRLIDQYYSSLERAAAATVLPILLALTSITCGITYEVEPTTSRRYITSSLMTPFRRRTARRVSISEARRIALEVLRQANVDLQEERMSEASFVFRFWNERND